MKVQAGGDSANSGKNLEALRFQAIMIEKIESGDFLPGEKLPGERCLSTMYGISRRAVRRVLHGLSEKGYVSRRRGAGTFVRQKAADKMDLSYLSELGNAGISAIMKNYGVKVSGKVLTKGVTTARFFCYKLGLAAGERVYVLHRIRYGNDEPIAVEYSYLPADLFSGIEALDFSGVSLYDYMDSKGHMPRKFRQKLQIVEINERERTCLDLQRKAPVYYLEFTGYDEHGTIVEYTESYARCDKFEFRFDNQA